MPFALAVLHLPVPLAEDSEFRRVVRRGSELPLEQVLPYKLELVARVGDDPVPVGDLAFTHGIGLSAGIGENDPVVAPVGGNACRSMLVCLALDRQRRS